MPLDIYPMGVYTSGMKSTSSVETRKLVQRLKIIEGQIRGLQDMLHNKSYCIDVITQTSAVKRALSGVEDALMESHLNSCVHRQMASGQTGKVVEEVLKVYKLKRK